ncbi:MAG: hypothetical protein LBR76_08805 [Oscillospiraceae bacterium]|nr:hypothetical protein [Oscillospiraceae bacterium]
MKNQGFWIIRILAFALCLFVVGYMGYHVFDSFSDPIRTVTAVLTATSEALPVEGVVVRDEQPLQLPPGVIELIAAESERVSAGQAIAVTYQNETARANSRELAAKIARRDLLAYIATYSGIVTDTAALDSELRTRTAALLSDVAGGTLSGLSEQSVEIKALLFRQEHFYEGSAILTPLINQLNAEIDALSASVASASTSLRAERPGLFSPLTDGLESVWTPESLDALTVSGFTGLSERRPSPPDETKGRLVNGWTWRFVCLLPEYEAKTLASVVTIRFTGGLTCQMIPEAVSEAEDGQCVVTFTADRYIDRVISERRLQGELIFTDYEGVRIPQNGLRYDNETGGYYVYCLLLGRAVRKDVTLYGDIERDNYYLAEYAPGVRNALLPGDEIITDGKDLYDGKVIE